jgi:hypothetical protein
MQGTGAEGAFQEREQLLDTEASAAHAELAALVGGSFEGLCDAKHAGSDVYYRLSNEKVGPFKSSALCCTPLHAWGHHFFRHPDINPVNVFSSHC